jgi:hypothetical protein
VGRALKIALACTALLAALLGFAWHTWRGIERGAGSWVAGDARATTAQAARRVAWRPAEPFLTSSTSARATRIALAPDGRSAVVAYGERGQDATLWFVELDGERVLADRPLTEIDAPGDEVAPWFDGDRLWFASDREGSRGGLDLWQARYDGARFERPVNAGGDVNSEADDTEPTVHADELVFASDRGGDGFDLWTSRIEGDAGAVRLDALCTSGDERDPAFAPDGGSLWFSVRSGGSFDLARAFRASAEWLPPERADALCSADDERAPCPIGGGFDVAFLRSGDAPAAWRARSVELALVPPLAWTWAEILLLASLIALAATAWFARDVSRYDALIAAWAISVSIHVLLLLLFGDVRLRGSDAGDRDDGHPAIRVRVAPADGAASLASSARGGAGRLERADTVRELSGPASSAAGDLAARVAGPVESLASPARGAVVDVDRDVELALEGDASGGIPLAAVAVVRPQELGPARATRAVPTESGLERRALPAASHDATATTASRGAPLALERAEMAPPAVARTELASTELASTELASTELASTELARAPTTERALPLSERELPALPATDASAGQFPPDASRALAALAPAATSRGIAVPRIARYAPERDDGPRDREDGARSTRSLLEPSPEARESAGLPPPAPREAATPYASRSGPGKLRALEEHGGTRATEAAVAKGLAYLARIQGRLGSWGPVDVSDEKYGEVCVGKTALATLAFLAAGHTHASSTEYSAVVQRALAFLLAVQDRSSGHYGDTSAYGHGIATFALAEALAITQDDSLRASVERAVAHLLERQSRDPDPRKFGGWPYYYIDPERTFDPWPRTSITAWHVLALESARLSGLDVPDAAFEGAARFLDAAHQPDADWYRYAHDPTRLDSGYPTLPASTPAALFALSCIGRDISGPRSAGARRYVLERAPRGYRFTNERDFVERGQGNPYFWYQGTLAMLRVGGREWQRWNIALQETLLPAQESDGSWRPIDAYARYARDDAQDRAYTTALCVLCLEVYYRYDLPLLKASKGSGAASAGAVPAASPR